MAVRGVLICIIAVVLWSVRRHYCCPYNLLDASPHSHTTSACPGARKWTHMLAGQTAVGEHVVTVHGDPRFMSCLRALRARWAQTPPRGCSAARQ